MINSRHIYAVLLNFQIVLNLRVDLSVSGRNENVEHSLLKGISSLQVEPECVVLNKSPSYVFPIKLLSSVKSLTGERSGKALKGKE